jgi:hypothetical protein
MNITMVTLHACVRAQKTAVALIQRGHQLRMICENVPQFWEQHRTLHLCENQSQISNSIKLVDDSTDIYHVHNEPSWLVTFLKERTDKPIVLDIHDSFLARTTPEQQEESLLTDNPRGRIVTEERNNFQLADGLVFPGEAFKDLVVSEFGLDQPALIMPSYMLKMWYNYAGAEYLGGLAYEGLVVSEERLKVPGMEVFDYANYTPLAQSCSEAKVDFYVYLGKNRIEDKRALQQFAKVFDPQDLENLLIALSRHDWGLVGNSYKCSNWDLAFPNKLFEYMAAGLPIVVMNASECARLAQEYNIGIIVDSVDELVERWDEKDICRNNVIKHRQEFAMENHIFKLERFYEQFV